MSQDYEGWTVRIRSAVIALGLFMGGLLTLIAATGMVYTHRYAAMTRAEPQRFPSPVLETTETSPTDTRSPPQSAPPAGIDHAMAVIVARGDAIWMQP